MAFDRYVATVRDESQHVWQFEFTPNDWEPSEGDYEAEIYYLRGVEGLVLLLSEDGVLFPAFTPKKVSKCA